MATGSMAIGAAAGAGPVLIVEDDEQMRSLLVSLVQALGFKDVAPFGQLEPALRQLEYQTLSMVIVDLHLGGHDGVSLIAAIRESARPEIKSLPVLVASASSTHSRIHASIQAGADAFLSKPFSVANLKRQIEFAHAKAESRRFSHRPLLSRLECQETVRDVLELD